ncbi:hypothetical protein [Salsuginibacillus kocurii]|uniref:hypothetical protein n=1 Tax=Salsuginibacillus kocurii TaxID=427078 RepID=UPI00036C166D|nr:hypothetical protein [Salsuginibacillus kocurii]
MYLTYVCITKDYQLNLKRLEGIIVYCQYCGTNTDNEVGICASCYSTQEQSREPAGEKQAAAAATEVAYSSKDLLKEFWDGFLSYLQHLKFEPYNSLTKIGSKDWKNALVIFLLFSFVLPFIMYRFAENIAGGMMTMMGSGGPSLSFSSFVFPPFFGFMALFGIMTVIILGAAKSMQVSNVEFLQSMSRLGLLMIPATGVLLIGLFFSFIAAFDVAILFVALAFILKIVAFVGVIYSYSRSKPEDRGLDPFYVSSLSMVLYIIVLFFAGRTLLASLITDVIPF